MKSILKRSVFIVLPAALVLMSCGGSDKKTGDGNDAKPEAGARSAAATLKPVDLTSYGIPLTIQAPEGAVVTKEEGSNDVVVKKDRFNIVVREDKFGDEGATPEQAKETAMAEDSKLLNDADLGMKMEVLKSDPRGYVFMTTNRAGGKVVRFTCFVSKDGKNYVIKENTLELNDMEKATETGYAISREEAEAMYNAVKQ